VEIKLLSTIDLPRELWGEGSPGVLRALTRAGSSALLAARAEAVRQVRETIAVKAEAVRSAISLRGPVGNVADGLSWYLLVKGKGLPVAAYPYRRTKTGISAEIKRGRRSLIPHAFEATVTAGRTGTHSGVFLRTGKYGRRGNPRLEKIREVFTTRVVDVFADAGVVEAIAARGTTVFRETFERNLAVARGG
jgi:hypothetical protein